MLLSEFVPKKKVGKPPLVSVDEYTKKFLQHKKEVFVNGEIVKCGSDIYQTIADELNLKCSNPSKTVYLAAKRFALKNSLTFESNYKNESEDEDICAELEDDYSDGEYTLFDKSFKISENDKSYSIDIRDIGLFSYSDDEIKLQSEWSDTLNQIIWEFSRLPCAWRFDRHKNVANEKIVFGTCRSEECNAKLFVYTENRHSKLNIVIKNFNPDAIHVKKRAIKHSNKEKIAELLKINKTTYVHAELTNDIVESSDYCPAHLPNKSTLNKLKQREKEKQFRDQDSIRSLCILKTESKFFKSITDIGIDPFYCFFSTPEQKEWLRLSTRYKRCVISIDSTGAPVKPPQYSSLSSSTGNLKPIFLYVISIQTDGVNQPIFQVLSQRHTSDFIAYCMRYWRYAINNQRNPHEIVMDNSSALILASVQAFTKCQTKIDYLNACFDQVFQVTESKVECFIRLDRSHIVKEILRNEIFNKQDRRVKTLLQRLLGFLITVSDVKIAEKIIRNIFILILNKFEHSDKISEIKWDLTSISENNDITDMIDEEKDYDVCDLGDDGREMINENVKSKFKNWITNIIGEVRYQFVDEDLNNINTKAQKKRNLIENVYYINDENGKLEKELIDFLSTIPLWSNIMMNSFGSKNSTATSSPTEVEFKNVKHLIFNNEKGIRVDIFLEKYLNYLLGKFKFSLSNNKNRLDEFKNDEEISTDQNSIIEVSQEIWRDKNVDVLKKQNVVKSNRSTNSILDKIKPFSEHIPILPNGGSTKGNSRNPTIVSYNTCSFDVLYQIYAAFYKDIPQIRNSIDKSKRGFDKFVKNSFTITIDELVKERSLLLCSLFPGRVNSCQKNMKTIDAFMCINEMFTVVASKSTVVFSMKSKEVCPQCNSVTDKKTQNYAPMQFQGDWKDIIQNLQKYISINEKNTNTCQKCSSHLDLDVEFNDVVIVNIEDAYPDSNIYSIEIEKISKYIILNGKKYEFRAAIQYTSAHFIAHIFRNDNKWKTFDGIKDSKIQKTPRSFYSVQYYFVAN